MPTPAPFLTIATPCTTATHDVDSEPIDTNWLDTTRLDTTRRPALQPRSTPLSAHPVAPGDAACVGIAGSDWTRRIVYSLLRRAHGIRVDPNSLQEFR